jgi:hypothetical protein
MELSLAQTHRKGDVTPGFAPQQSDPEAIDRRRFSWPLERRCGKRDNYYAHADPDTGDPNQRWR